MSQHGPSWSILQHRAGHCSWAEALAACPENSIGLPNRITHFIPFAFAERQGDGRRAALMPRTHT